MGYRYAASIVPWDRADAVRVWTDIGIDFLLDLGNPLAELEQRGRQYVVTVPIRISLLAGPPDASGELRPVQVANIGIAAAEILAVPDGVGLELNPTLLSPFQLGSPAVLESTLSVWFEDDYRDSSATVVLGFSPSTAEPEVSADRASLLVVLRTGRLADLSLRLASGSTANWSVTEERDFTFELRAIDRYGYIFNPPAESLQLAANRPPGIAFIAGQDSIGSRTIDFRDGLASWTLRFRRLENSDTSIILTVLPNTAPGQPYADLDIQAMLRVDIPQIDVSRFRVSIEVVRQQTEAAGLAEVSVSVRSLDANDMPLIGPLAQTTGIGLQGVLIDTAGEEYGFELNNFVFVGAESSSSFTVALNGYDARLLAAELTGTTVPYDVLVFEFKLIAVEQVATLTLTVTPPERQQQVFGQPSTFLITVQSAGTKGGRPNPLGDIRLSAAFQPEVISWSQIGVDSPATPLSFTNGMAVVEVMVTPLRPCDSDPCRPESLEFFVSGAAARVTSNRVSVAVVPAPVLASVTIQPIAQSQLQALFEGASVFVEERIVIDSSGTDGRPFVPSGLSLRLIGTNLRIAGGETTLPLMFDVGGRAEADISYLRLSVGEQGLSGSLKLEIVGAPTMPEVSIIAIGTTIDVLEGPRTTTLSATFSAPNLQESSWRQPSSGDSLVLSADISAQTPSGEALSPAGLSLRISGDGIRPASQDIRLDFVDGTAQVMVTVELQRQGYDGLLRAALLVGDSPVPNLVPTTITLVAQEVLASAKITALPPQVAQIQAGTTLSFTVWVSEALGSKGTPWSSENLRLGVSGDNVVATSFSLSIVDGTATALAVTVALADPYEDGTAQLELLSRTEYLDAALALTQEPAEGVALIALPVLTELRVTVENQPPMFVLSSTAAISIQLRVTAGYLAKRTTTVLSLMVNGLAEPLSWQITIPRDETSVSMERSVQLGTLRQATVSFTVVDPPPGVAVISDAEVVVSLVPTSLTLSLSPSAVRELAPRDETTAEVRVRVRALDSENRAFAGLSGLIVQTAVTAVTAGQQRSDVSVSASAVEETEPGVYDSTLMVTLGALIHEASLRLEVVGVAGENLRSAAVAELSLARQATLDSLELSLADDALDQSAPGAAVQTTATVVARDQFGEIFSPPGLRLRVVDSDDGSEVLVTTPVLVFDAQGKAQSVLMSLTPPRGRDQNLRVEVVGVTDPEVRTNTVTLELRAVEVLGSLTVTGPASTLTQTMRDEAVGFELTVTAAGTKGTQPWQLTESLELQYTAAPGVRVRYDSALMFSTGVVTVTVSVTPVPGIDARVTFDVTGTPDDVVTSPAELSVIAAEVLSTITLTVQNGLMRTVRSGEEEILITVQLMAEYLGENKPEQTTLRLRAVDTNGVVASAMVDVIILAGESTTTDLILMLGTTARQSTVSFEVVNLPAEVSLVSPEVRVELVPVPVSLALSATPQAMLDLGPRGDVTAEFRVRVEVRGSDGRPFGGLSDLVLATTVTAVVTGDAGDLAFLSAAFEEAATGVYESIVRVMIAPDRVSMASVEITVADDGTSGLASVSTTVQLARRVVLDNLRLSLSDDVLEQSVPGASVQTTATVVVLDQFVRPFSPPPGSLRLRVVDTAADAEALVATRALVFDALGQAQSLLSLIPPRGTNQDLRVELLTGIGDAELRLAMADLRIEAAEALGRVILTVVGGSEQFVSTNSFSIALELSLESAGNRPLTAATELPAVRLQVSIVSGTLAGTPSFDVRVSGEAPSSVDITGMVAGNASSATISLSIVGGVPADTPVLILPADTVKVNLVADLDVDDNAVFDVRDAVLMLRAATSRAANMPLPGSIPARVRERLEQLLSPDNPDMRMDVDGNGVVEPIDVRLLLRYLAGLRGGSLMEGAADTAAIERRARAMLDPNR